MLDAFGLWLGGLVLGTVPASNLAISLFLITGLVTAAAPLLLGMLLYPRAGFNSILAGTIMTFFSFILGLAITLTPLVHAEQFIKCESRPTVYQEKTVNELWCAERLTLDEQFGEMKFVGFAQTSP